MSFNNIVIPVDGVAGAGKGTAIAMVAQHFKDRGKPVLAFSGGSLYRTVALLARLYRATNCDELVVDSGHDLVELSRSHGLRLLKGWPHLQGIPVPATMLDLPEVLALVAKVAAASLVRQFAETQILSSANYSGLVLVDGRDGGTTTFVDAKLKIWLAVSDEESARRRDQPVEIVRERNERDRTRAISPMIAASDAVVIDTTELDREQVAARVIAEILRVYPELA